ncbi:YceI family protein [Paraburkholderia sp. RL18-103-BIB-C]
MKNPKFSRWLQVCTSAVSLLAVTPAFALATVDTAKSTVIATSRQMNVPVDGKFRKFTAQLDFDPAKPAVGSANLTIDTSSYDLGDESYNQQVRGKDWFDTAQFPNATFVSSAIASADGANRFKVIGKLTIKGKSQNVVVPVTVTQQGASQTFDGLLPIKRTQYDIGTGEWKDTSVVADEVVIKFHIVAARQVLQ